MPFSRTRLHASILRTAEDAAVADEALAKAFPHRVAKGPLDLALPSDSYDIPLTTISRNTSFDSYIQVAVQGAPTQPMTLVVDTGNSVPILPSWATIEQIPNWGNTYTVLEEGPTIAEPWGAPAKLVKGPLELTAADGSVFAMEDCIFYACTGIAPGETEPTANFGAGCLTQYTTEGVWTLRPAQTSNPAYPYAEFDFAPDHAVLSLTRALRIETTSTLRISKMPPAGYQMFDIVPATWWMALVPRALSIGAVKTAWPNSTQNPIAMIDTGGTCAYLSDPDAFVYKSAWPDPAQNPDWTKDSVSCQSTSEAITLELGDDHASFSYTLDTSGLPAPVQGLTLVMCEKNSFMMDQYGLNIGGVSALAVGILVDYQNARVGLKLK
jgi:hypothetical protein